MNKREVTDAAAGRRKLGGIVIYDSPHYEIALRRAIGRMNEKRTTPFGANTSAPVDRRY
jgi:hypothetical protein